MRCNETQTANAVWLKTQAQARDYKSSKQRIKPLLMHKHTCSKAELRAPDRVLNRIFAVWHKWRRFSLAILRLAFRREYWGLLGNQLRCLKSGDSLSSLEALESTISKKICQIWEIILHQADGEDTRAQHPVLLDRNHCLTTWEMSRMVRRAAMMKRNETNEIRIYCSQIKKTWMKHEMNQTCTLRM